MKPLVRVLAFDDGAFVPRQSKSALLVGVLSRLDNRLEGIVSAQIKVDGWNATQRLVFLANQTRLGKQAHFLVLSGINFAGFNIADLPVLFKKTKKPVLAVFRKKPRFFRIQKALRNLSNPSKRWRLIEKAGPVFSANGFFFQCVGISEKEARRLLESLCQHSNLPEPLRLAHLIASGVSLGESTRP